MPTSTLPTPRVPQDLSSFVKPEELVDIVEVTPLTLQDRRIYNLLLANAWNNIQTQTKHTISRQTLVQHVNSHNQDIGTSLDRLMATIVQIRIRRNHNGEPAVRRIALLGSNEMEVTASRGSITYVFPPELLKVIKDTQIFARLHTKVMFELTSKYSLTLYEFLQRRKNLKHIDHEILPLSDIRGLLGVPPGKLKTFGHLNKYALQVATQEVSFLTEYEITAAPIRTGRAVTHIKFSWAKKTDLGAQISAVEELERSKVGRPARRQGQVEQLALFPGATQITDNSTHRYPLSSQKTDIYLSTDLIEAAREIVLDANTGWDLYAIEQQFKDYIKHKGPPANLEGAFIGFVRKKVKTRP